MNAPVGMPRDVDDARPLRHLPRRAARRPASRTRCRPRGRQSRSRRATSARSVAAPARSTSRRKPGAVGVDPPEMRDAPVGRPVGRRQHEGDGAAVGRDLRVADARDVEQVDERHRTLGLRCVTLTLDVNAMPTASRALRSARTRWHGGQASITVKIGFGSRLSAGRARSSGAEVSRQEPSSV